MRFLPACKRWGYGGRSRRKVHPRVWPGGQKINKTSSCVYLKHLPTGIEIKCQQGRSREMNRYYARKELCQRLEEKDQNIQVGTADGSREDPQAEAAPFKAWQGKDARR